MCTYSQLSVAAIAIFVTFNSLRPVDYTAPAEKPQQVVLVSGNRCNGSGFEQYLQNTDPGHDYLVRVKITGYRPGESGLTEEKVLRVNAGGKTLAGCSQSPLPGGPVYNFTLVGLERIKEDSPAR